MVLRKKWIFKHKKAEAKAYKKRQQQEWQRKLKKERDEARFLETFHTRVAKKAEAKKDVWG